MKIKKAILLSSLLIYITINCQAQEYDSSYLKLPGYQVDSCLFGLLATVAQSNKQYYNTDVYFYSLTFKEGTKSRYINITPEKWAEARYLDYGGILKIHNTSFLFRGDFEHDLIFKHSSLADATVNLKREKGDLDKGAAFLEPALQGEYYECSGMPIYIEVYTKGKIPGFDMKVRASKSE